jgi:hypothetical protein
MMRVAGSSWAQPTQYQKVRPVENTCPKRRQNIASDTEATEDEELRTDSPVRSPYICTTWWVFEIE